MFALAEQRIKLLYDDAYTRALKIAEVKKALDDAVNADFNFKAFPRAQKQLKSIMEELSINIEKVAKNGLNEAVSSGLEASMANVLAISSAKETKKMAEEATDASRLNQAFGTRIANAKRGGITLSENIWKAVSTSAKELEIIIQNNIIEGKGAVVASREVRQYLNDPRRLYRRVKDKETGEYKLSKAAQQYHPGQGKYRSSFMNARRLMVSEMNMATQASECEAYASNPLIAGYEIRLSNNHTVKDPNHKGEVLPLKDICDELQGLYPPTFKFTGWHPHCRCSMVPVLISPEERRKLAQARAEGKPYKPSGVVTDVPANFKNWLANNQDRIAKAKSMPFFLQDNGEMTKDGFVLGNFGNKKSNALQVAEKRHAERTPQQAEAIRKHAQEREERLEQYSLLKKQSGNILNVAKDYGEVDFVALEDIVSKVNSSAIYRNTDMSALKAEMQSIIGQIQKQKTAEKALSDIIPDVHQWHKTVSLAELQQVKTEVESKLSTWDHYSPEEIVKKLEWEAVKHLGGNIGGVQEKYPKTWKITQSAYLHIRDLAKYKIAVNTAKNQIKPITDWAEKHKKYNKINGLITEFDNYVQGNETDINQLQSKVDAVNKEYERIQQEEDKLNSNVIARSVTFGEDAFTQERKDNAIWDKVGGKEAEKALYKDASKLWTNATERQRDYMFDYTGHYCDVNEPLRGVHYQRPQTKEHFTEKVNAITTYISQSKTEKDMWFMRGDKDISAIESRIKFAGGQIPDDINDMVGMVMQEGGFMSTGSSKGHGFDDDDKHVILNIYAPKGTMATYVEPFSPYGRGERRDWDGIRRFTDFSGEQETIFQRGTIMRITRVYQSNGKTYIDCEVIGQEPKPLSYVDDKNISL